MRRVLFGQRPQLLLDRALAGMAVDAVQARQHALDVAVQDRDAQAVRLGQDGAGGRAADAGQGGQRVEVARQLAAVAFHAQPRGAVQEARAAVVAQARPQRQHGVLVGARQVGQGGQGVDEALEIVDDGGDLGLLQHDFRQPHPIGAARVLPGQVVSAVDVEPGQQRFGDGCHGVLRAVAGAAVDPALAGAAPSLRSLRPLMCSEPMSMRSASRVPTRGGGGRAPGT